MGPNPCIPPMSWIPFMPLLPLLTFPRAGEGAGSPPHIVCQLVFLKGWNDFGTKQFNRAHHVFMTHVAFVPVDQDIAWLEILFHIPEFFNDRLRAADHNIVRLLQLLIAHASPHSTCANEGARHFDTHCLTGL